MFPRLLFAAPLAICALALAADSAPTGSTADTAHGAEATPACDAADCDPEALRRFELPTIAVPLQPYEDGLSFVDLSQVDVRGAYRTIDQVRQDVGALSPEGRARAAASMQVLTVTCAYTRTSVQLPVVLHQLVMGLDPVHVDPLVDHDVAYLQRGLGAHVEILEALGVGDLAVPRPGDALHGVGGPGAFVDRQTLRGEADPLQATRALVEAIPPGIEEGEVLERIRRHTHEVDQITGHPWTLLPHLLGWHAALRRLEPFVVDSEQRGRVQEAIAVLDDFANRGC